MAHVPHRDSGTENRELRLHHQQRTPAAEQSCKNVDMVTQAETIDQAGVGPLAQVALTSRSASCSGSTVLCRV